MEDWHYHGEHVFDGATYEGDYFRQEDLKCIRDELEFKKDDIVVATYPKAGTTWTQEIVWLLQHGPGSADTREQSFEELFPFLEMYVEEKSGLERIEEIAEPRLIKTHLNTGFYQRQLSGESPCPKFIVVLREPRDLLVSYYKFHLMYGPPWNSTRSWEYFFEMFREKRLNFGDYFEHALSWWKYREHPNVLIVKYEDMKKDACGSIKAVADFLNIPTTDTLIQTIAHESSFQSMKARGTEKISSTLAKQVDQGEGFFRAGKVGSWKDTFTDEQSQYVQDLTAKKFNKEGIYFD